MDSGINAEVWNSGIEGKISKSSESQTQPCICKVHEHLRIINAKAYEPEIIAIGPYHRRKSNLEMMEKHKVLYLKSLLKRKSQNLDIYIAAMKGLEKEARSCYAEPIGLETDEFIEMLVLDGCFIIELMLKYLCMLTYGSTSCNGNDPILETGWIMTSLKRDLILFENQIPFFVLCNLFDMIWGRNQHNDLIDFVLLFCWSLYPGAATQEGMTTDWSSKDVKHLLDLFHSYWRPLPQDGVCINVFDVTIGGSLKAIHCATLLKDANVEFEVMTSKHLFDVKFDNGKMQMPPLRIDDNTECVFRNLIAYEQYFPNNRYIFVTDYVRLMDWLIHSSSDVEIFSTCGIIDNWLGDNEVVAQMFNRITDSVTCSGFFLYAETFRQLNDHCNHPPNRWMAILCQKYLGSPWAYISFFAALLVIFLTLAQTVFSVLQVV